MKRSGWFVWLVGIVAASLVLAACGSPAATATQAGTEASPTTQAATEKKVTASGFECPEPTARMEVTSSELNMFVWTEYIPQDIIDCFELVYGVKVNRDEFSSAEEMFAKLSAGSTGYDVVHVSDNVVPPSIRLGLLEKLDKSKLSIMADFDPTYLNLSFDPSNDYTLPYEAGTDAIMVNTDTIKDVPTSWADLWKPEYAGKIVSIDDSRAIIGITLMTLGYDVNTTDPKELDEAKAKLKELMPNIKLFDSDSPKTALIAGDADIGILFNGEAFLAQQENSALQYIYPKEGPIVWQDNWAIAANAPHPDAAYAWLNYSMQPNLFWMMLRDFPYTNPSTAVLEFAKHNHPDLYEAYIHSNITNVPPEVIARGQRAVDVGEATPLFDQIWVEVKGGQ